MKMNRVAIGCTLINLLVMTVLFTQLREAKAQQQNVIPILRARALEIVDNGGKVRASISIQPPVEVEGKKYPQTVLLRLIDSKGKPLVKLAAAENGAGLTLTNTSDEGILMHGNDDGSFVRITHKGKKQLIEP